MAGRLRVGDVFVAGGQPTVTYVPRTQHGLEASVDDYIDARRKILVITGPTKSGKTVLARRMFPVDQCIWISGGNVPTATAFWEQVIAKTGTPLEVTERESEQTSTGSGETYDVSGEVGGGAIPMKLGGKFSHTGTRGNSSATDVSYKRATTAAAIGPRALRDSGRALVVDDFHYIDEGLQRDIVRALKELVFDGVAVVFLAVPHRAAAAVRAEREMNGRVANISIPPWADDELHAVAMQGWERLNLVPAPGIAARLVTETFGSPHLMQDVCRRLCRSQNIREEQPTATKLEEPPDWSEFFRSYARGQESADFDLLARGPVNRTDRKRRATRDGGPTIDIYGATLMAMASCIPPLEMTWEKELRPALKKILNKIPQRHEVADVITLMVDISKKSAAKGSSGNDAESRPPEAHWDGATTGDESALDRDDGDAAARSDRAEDGADAEPEDDAATDDALDPDRAFSPEGPVLDWDPDHRKLYITDPFFAYYLRWNIAPQE